MDFSQGFSRKVVSTICFVFDSLPTRGNFCCLMITFANSLDPDLMVLKNPAFKELNMAQH